jgi:predicted GTPase
MSASREKLFLKAFAILRNTMDIIHESLYKIENDEENPNPLSPHCPKPKMEHVPILLIGDCRVGKTSFINKIKDVKSYYYEPTDCITSYDIVDEKRQIIYKIYDLAGDTKEDPRDMLDWFDDVEHIVMMCSMDDYASIKSLKYWMREYSYFNRPYSIIVNKVDVLECMCDKKKMKYEKKIEHIARKNKNAKTRYISVHDDKKEELLLDLYKVTHDHL